MSSRYAWYGVLGLVVFLLVFILLQFFGLFTLRFFGPKYESARREIFQETKSYIFAANQDLAKYHYEWVHQDEQGKRAIEELVRQRFPELPPEKVFNPHLRQWFAQIMSGRSPSEPEW